MAEGEWTGGWGTKNRLQHSPILPNALACVSLASSPAPPFPVPAHSSLCLNGPPLPSSRIYHIFQGLGQTLHPPENLPNHSRNV